MAGDVVVVAVGKWVTRSVAQSYPLIHSRFLWAGRRGVALGETELSPRVVRCWDVRQALILESGIQVFGRNDFSLFGLFVEDGVGERFLLVKQGDVTSRILADSYLGLAHGIGWAFRLDLVDDFFKLDGQVFGERARFLPG